MKRYNSKNIVRSNEAVTKLASAGFSPFKSIYISLSLVLLMVVGAGISSCNKFLDVVPDNVQTIEHAFKLRNEAEKYLFTLYSYLPKDGDGWYNIGTMSGDEIWLPQEEKSHWHNAFRIAQGEQNKDEPLVDVWAGLRAGGGSGSNKRLFTAIRHCNFFLENMNDPTKVPDITISERNRWIGEAEFLKAYYHYYLLRMYGPIPIIDKNLSIDADIEETNVKRMPVDDCVNYISGLLDAASEKLPPRIMDESTEMGRITQPIALAVKAKLWLLAASPLFNGNTDYAGFKDKDGVALVNQVMDNTKWEKARDAAKAAIDAALMSGHELYEYKNDVYGLSNATKTQLSIRQAVCDRWSTEHVWANSNSYFINENLCMIPLTRAKSPGQGRFLAPGIWAAPIKIAKMFYSSNGVPINEDKTLSFTNYEQIRTSTTSEQFNIEPGYQTARLNFDREPRFYADLGFDGSVWYKKDSPSLTDIGTFYVEAKNGQKAGTPDFRNSNETGYFIKKLVHWEMVFGDNAVTYKQYPWPEIRLSDLYLMYAEALNEAEPASPVAIEYLDKVRKRAGLKGVVESWTNYSNNPSKYTTKSGLREIIHRERLIELAFEGHRFWDLRRWKEAAEELNKPITGWNVLAKTTDTYYKERVVFNQSFITPRDYLWPIGNFDTRRNHNLVENPGW